MESARDLDCFPQDQGRLLWHYLVVNRAGRRLLTSSHPIPDGLWSRVLERASDEKRYTCTIGEMGGDLANEGGHVAKYNAVYFLLQNFL